jgi:hypothetical protein
MLRNGSDRIHYSFVQKLCKAEEVALEMNDLASLYGLDLYGE